MDLSAYPRPAADTGWGKLALHLQTVPPWAQQVVTPSAFAWVKAIDPGPVDLFPGVRTLGRLWIGGDNLEQEYVNECERGAERYFWLCLPRYKAAPWVYAWSGPNEPRPFWDGLLNLTRFSQHWVNLMHGEGLRAVVGELSVGQPAIGDIAAMAEALEVADFLSFHEYAQPDMQHGQSWLCLRYRRQLAILRAQQIRIPPLLITECGIDGGAVLPGEAPESGKGWRTYADNEEHYMTQLAWYAGEIAKDPEVLAAFVFTAGPTLDWRDFEVTESLARRIAEYNQTQAQPPPVPPPQATYPCSDRAGMPVTAVVWHGAEGRKVADYLATQTKKSAHYAIEADGTVTAMVPEAMAAWHCAGSSIPGIPDGNVDGTDTANLGSIGIELACDPPPAAPGWTEAQINAAVKLGRELAARYQLAPGQHYRHSDVDLTKRDPREFPMARLLDAIYEPVIPPAEREEDMEELIRKAAWKLLGVPYNPLHAFPRVAREADLGAPLEPETDVTIDGITWRWQPFSRGIVAAKVGAWHDCKVIRW